MSEQPIKNRLLGRTILGIRPLTEIELTLLAWPSREEVLALILEKGLVLFAQADLEGNSPGVLTILDPRQAETTCLLPPPPPEESP